MESDALAIFHVSDNDTHCNFIIIWRIALLTKLAAAAAIMTVLFAVPSFAAETKWGALALDTEKAEREPYYGVGGADTEQEAIDAAMGFCKDAGGVACKSMVTYEQCGALAVSGKGSAGWAKAATKADAEANAVKACEDAECKVATSDCNE